MVVLGLGTNLPDRLTHLRQTLQLIKRIPGLTVKKVSPVYLSDALLPENAPPEWNSPYLNSAVLCDTSLTPQDVLRYAKKIELLVGRTPEKKWGPRIVDIDILAWDDLVLYDDQLHIPHEHLSDRPFALWPLADVMPHWIFPLPNLWQGKTAAEIASQWGSRWSGKAPFRTRLIPQRIDTPELMGIVNITPDSFSDGGRFADPAHALAHIKQLVHDGADIIDLGAEATGPTATLISPEQEWQRLQPLLDGLLPDIADWVIKPKISIDTRHAATAEKALSLGVDWINDVSGLEDPNMCAVIAHHGCDAVLMHQLGIPASQTKRLAPEENPVPIVLEWAMRRLEKLIQLGLSPDKLIVDIGIGYGKSPTLSIQLLENIEIFKKIPARLLIGHSRKSFLSALTEQPVQERDLETTLFSLFLAAHQVDFLRVHNIAMHARAFALGFLFF